jgi:hypothetical protein
MAIFEDVSGKAQVVSTGSNARSESVSDVSERHKLDGSVERDTHTVTAGPNGQTMTVDTSEKSQTIHGTVFHTTEVVSDDGMGHRTETLTRSFDQQKGGAVITQAESVSKNLAAGESAVDLTKALEDRGTLGVSHDMTLSRTSKDASGTTHSDTLVHHFDTVGNESNRHIESVSRASVQHGIESVDTISRTEADGKSSIAATHSEVSMGRDGRAYEASEQRSQSESHSDGLSAHVSQSLTGHLVKNGYSAEEARNTVAGISESLGHAIGGHSMGTAGSVEFHKQGPVAVSMSSGHAESTSNTVAVSMDELKKVHESGQSQDLTSGHHASTMQTAANEMSR